MEGFDLLGEKDYRKMKESQHALRQNWRIIRAFIRKRNDKIMRDIKREIE